MLSLRVATAWPHGRMGSYPKWDFILIDSSRTNPCPSTIIFILRQGELIFHCHAYFLKTPDLVLRTAIENTALQISWFFRTDKSVHSKFLVIVDQICNYP